MVFLQLELLGDLQMRSREGSLVNIAARKSQALLVYLGMQPNHFVSRDKLAATLWTSTGPDQARQSLRQTLSALRKELALISPLNPILVEQNDLLSLDSTLAGVDAVKFENLAATGTEEALRNAQALYRGDFLEGFLLNEDRFDQWVLAERERLNALARKVSAQLVEAQSGRGAIDEAIGTAQRALRLDPLQESVHRILMRLYLQRGDLVDALQQFESCAKILRRELRIDPDPETKALHQQILQLRAKGGQSADSSAPAGSDKKSVLVVEDNQLNRELTNAVLKAAGYDVLLAKDGAEALMIMGREHVDLLLLDIDLPFIDGHSVLQALKENGVEVPTIFISGLPGEEPELKAFEGGASDFIRKPVKNNVLLARIARVLKTE